MKLVDRCYLKIDFCMQAAEKLRITASELCNLDVADGIIPVSNHFLQVPFIFFSHHFFIFSSSLSAILGRIIALINPHFLVQTYF